VTKLVRLLAGLALLLATPNAPAADADALFREAQAAYQKGEFERAAELFEQAHALAPSANIEFNAAQSWRRAGQLARAAEAYEAALASGSLDEEMRDTSRRKLAELTPKVGRLEVDEPEGASVSIAHAVKLPIPARVYLEPGSYRALLQSGDKRWTRQVHIRAGETLRMSAPPPPVAPPPPPPPPPLPKKGPSASWIGGWVALGVAGAGGVAAIALGARFLVVLDRYEAGDYLDTTLEDEALVLRAATNVVAFSALAVAGVGLALVLTAPEATVSLQVGPRSTLQISF
jgi:tetratricopeptide (TPR) repeat protein